MRGGSWRRLDGLRSRTEHPRLPLQGGEGMSLSMRSHDEEIFSININSIIHGVNIWLNDSGYCHLQSHELKAKIEAALEALE